VFRTLISCAGAIAVAVIVVLLIRNTLHNEMSRPQGQLDAILSNGPGNAEPVQSFTSTQALSDYLVAAAQHDATRVNSLLNGPNAVKLESGTKVLMEGYSGPGQVRILITSGTHRGSHLYASYAVLQDPRK